MSTLREQYQIARDTALRERALAAIVSKARAVAVDPASSPALVQYAINVCQSPHQHTDPLALVIAATPGVQDLATVQQNSATAFAVNTDGITDAHIVTILDACWAALAPSS